MGDLEDQLTQGQLDAFFPDGFGDILSDPEAGLETLRNIQEGQEVFWSDFKPSAFHS